MWLSIFKLRDHLANTVRFVWIVSRRGAHASYYSTFSPSFKPAIVKRRPIWCDVGEWRPVMQKMSTKTLHRNPPKVYMSEQPSIGKTWRGIPTHCCALNVVLSIVKRLPPWPNLFRPDCCCQVCVIKSIKVLIFIVPSLGRPR